MTLEPLESHSNIGGRKSSGTTCKSASGVARNVPKETRIKIVRSRIAREVSLGRHHSIQGPLEKHSGVTSRKSLWILESGITRASPGSRNIGESHGRPLGIPREPQGRPEHHLESLERHSLETHSRGPSDIAQKLLYSQIVRESLRIGSEIVRGSLVRVSLVKVPRKSFGDDARGKIVWESCSESPGSDSKVAREVT